MSSEAPTDAPAGPPPTESKRTCVEQCCTAAVSPSRRRRGSAAVRSRLAPGCCALAAHGRQDGRGAALRTFPPSHHRSLCLRAHSTAHRPENWRKVRPRAAQTPVFLPPCCCVCRCRSGSFPPCFGRGVGLCGWMCAAAAALNPCMRREAEKRPEKAEKAPPPAVLSPFLHLCRGMAAAVWALFPADCFCSVTFCVLRVSKSCVLGRVFVWLGACICVFVCVFVGAAAVGALCCLCVCVCATCPLPDV